MTLLIEIGLLEPILRMEDNAQFVGGAQLVGQSEPRQPVGHYSAVVSISTTMPVSISTTMPVESNASSSSLIGSRRERTLVPWSTSETHLERRRSKLQLQLAEQRYNIRVRALHERKQMELELATR